MKERWRVVKDHPKYRVSNLGRVKNKISKRSLAPIHCGNNYHQVILNDGKHYLIHRLVAIHFIPNRKKYKTVCFKNRKKRKNCSTSNLKWSKNPTNFGMTLGIGKKTYQYSLSGKLLNKFPSAYKASQEISKKKKKNVKSVRTGIMKACRGEIKSAYGYKWEYKTK